MKVLVTGGNGFIGHALWRRLNDIAGFQAVAGVREATSCTDTFGPFVELGELSSKTNWSDALVGVDAVVHTAARVHFLNHSTVDSFAKFRHENVQVTLNLAHQAYASGVKRFLFLSTVKVNGEMTNTPQSVPVSQGGQAKFNEEAKPDPQDYYALSKWEAEQGLREIALQTGMQVVIIRPPLVYGPGVKANFAALIRAVKRGWPLPLGAIYNKRSFLALDNLLDFIITCIDHPQASNQTFLVCDGQDMSTGDLVRGLALGAGLPARLIPVPVWTLMAVASLLGKTDEIHRLCGNLQIDMSKAQTLLGWEPPVSVEEGLRRAMTI